jgi:hypothetical protein
MPGSRTVFYGIDQNIVLPPNFQSLYRNSRKAKSKARSIMNTFSDLILAPLFHADITYRLWPSGSELLPSVVIKASSTDAFINISKGIGRAASSQLSPSLDKS